MTRSLRSLVFAVGAFAVLICLNRPAQATFTFTIYQNGADVDMIGSGTINTQGLGSPNQNCATSGLISTFNNLIGLVGGPTTSTSCQVYNVSFNASGTLLSGAASTLASAAQGGGDVVALAFNTYINQFYVPVGYQPGASLSNSDVFANTTIADLGLNTGSYSFGFGSGQNADSIVVNVGPDYAPVPEPGSAVLMALPMVVLGLWRARCV